MLWKIITGQTTMQRLHRQRHWMYRQSKCRKTLKSFQAKGFACCTDRIHGESKRYLLLSKYSKNSKKLGDSSFDVADSPKAKKTEKKAA
jgi:hypothetical protein